MDQATKYLIIRFSSFGDILQCLASASALKQAHPEAEVHWLVRSDFAQLVEAFPHVDKVWAFDRQAGLTGLVHLAQQLKLQNYEMVYDAHNNTRSHIVSLILVPFWKRWLKTRPYFIRRSKSRLKRFVLFKMRLNYFPKPYRAIYSYLNPLSRVGLPQDLPSPDILQTEDSEVINHNKHHINDSIVLAPSAAWELKRWPVEYWGELVKSMPECKFTLVGGPDDQFCQTIAAEAPDRVVNLAGKLSWLESAQVIQNGRLTVSGDTGTLHLSDLVGKKTLALIGPTAFGYPSRASSVVLETKLSCKPCSKDGRGRCTNPTFKKCLTTIKPAHVAATIRQMIETPE